MHWATILLHNVDTLEVYKAALRQSDAGQHEATPAGPHGRHFTATQATGTPPTDEPSSSARGVGEGEEPDLDPKKP